MDSDWINIIDIMNKEFEEWFNKVWTNREENKEFCEQYGDSREGSYWTTADDFIDYFPPSIQWGVYLEFFDSKNIIITVDLRDGLFYEIVVFEYIQGEYSKLPHSFHTTRTEAQQEAIKKAFKILNK